MKRWGNCFEFIGCAQLYEGKRAADWLLHEKIKGLEFSFASILSYKDWDFDVYQAGQLHILKRNISCKIPWNENYYWGMPEDLRLSNDLRDEGYLLRNNPASSFNVLTYRIGELPKVIFRNDRISKKRTGDKKRIIGRKVYRIIYKIKPLKDLTIFLYTFYNRYILEKGYRYAARMVKLK
jgi:hypothetical protein